MMDDHPLGMNGGVAGAADSEGGGSHMMSFSPTYLNEAQIPPVRNACLIGRESKQERACGNESVEGSEESVGSGRQEISSDG